MCHSGLWTSRPSALSGASAASQVDEDEEEVDMGPVQLGDGMRESAVEAGSGVLRAAGLAMVAAASAALDMGEEAVGADSRRHRRPLAPAGGRRCLLFDVNYTRLPTRSRFRIPTRSDSSPVQYFAIASASQVFV